MKAMAAAAPIPLNGTCNFRDLGGYPAKGGRIRRGRFFRSDALDRLTGQDREWMRQHGIRYVIDLRGEEEARRHPDALGPEVEYVQIPMSDKVENQKGKRFYPADLSALYEEMLCRQGKRFAQVMHVLAAREDQPVVFHCAVGKDRTGLTAMLLLSIAGAERDVIRMDYAPSGENIRPLREKARQEAEQSGTPVPEQAFLSPPEAMDHAIDYVESRWGGPVEYLLENGVTPDEIQILRQRLVDKD